MSLISHCRPIRRIRRPNNRSRCCGVIRRIPEVGFSGTSSVQSIAAACAGCRRSVQAALSHRPAFFILPADTHSETLDIRGATVTSHLNSPHGGKLVNFAVSASRAAEIKAQSRDWPSWDLTPRQLCDLECSLQRQLLAPHGFHEKGRL